MITKEELYKGVRLFETALLKVSKNGMEATLSPIEDEIAPEHLKNLSETLKQHGITHGILEPPQFENGRWIVAKGTSSINGEDGRLEFLPQFEVLKEARHRSIKRFINIEKDSVIAEIIPPTPGISGWNVFGEKIPPKSGKAASFKLGPGVEVSPDGTSLVALRNGAIEFKNGEISVLDEYTVNGDLDITIGNLEFWGRLFTISGSISGAFKVSIWGDLVVKGNIEGGAQINVKGNLKVGGIIRGNKTCITTENDLHAKAIEYANISVNGDMEVEDYVLKAKCRVKGYGWVVQGRGMISGGNLFFGHSLAVNTLGSPTNIFTNISIGFDFDQIERHKKIVEQLEITAKKIDEVKNGLNKIEILEKQGPLNEKFSFIKQRLLETIVILGEEAMEKKERLQQLENELLRKQTATLLVTKNIYANTSITIYNARFYTNIDINGKHKFIYKAGEVLAIPLHSI
ncbi:MAG: DUF342 domain-containing protein [Dissulfurimicrobium sp.]|uniref:DUF342 domain-containing protein n=1 Tax=Dissulfurimicrobium sp. TaxID=2022436 RepID=UPI0040495E3D